MPRPDPAYPDAAYPDAARSDLPRRLAVLFVLLLLTAPAWGYVVFLKDGTQIITREAYRREGDKVYLVLQSGTETFIAASEVDFARTDELNEENIGLVRVLEDGADTRVVEEKPAERRQTLRDLASGTRLAAPENRGQAAPEVAPGTPQTRAGYVDLWSLERETYPDVEVIGELTSFLNGQGIGDAQIFRGTSSERVLLRMTASTEVAVFQALRDAAGAFVQTQNKLPDRVAALELVLSTEGGRRAGQFVLTRALADQLLSEAIDPPTFFYRHVRF